MKSTFLVIAGILFGIAFGGLIPQSHASIKYSGGIVLINDADYYPWTDLPFGGSIIDYSNQDSSQIIVRPIQSIEIQTKLLYGIIPIGNNSLDIKFHRNGVGGHIRYMGPLKDGNGGTNVRFSSSVDNSVKSITFYNSDGSIFMEKKF